MKGLFISGNYARKAVTLLVVCVISVIAIWTCMPGWSSGESVYVKEASGHALILRVLTNIEQVIVNVKGEFMS